MDILDKYKEELKKFCRKNKIRKLSLFGSYLKKNQNQESDIDLLVEFVDEIEYGLLDIARIERELSAIIKKKVDLRTPEELSRYFRSAVVKEAEVKYERR